MNRIDKRIFIWETNFSRDVVRLAVPILLQNLVMAMMFIVDNLMIGSLGESSLAGVTQANRVTFFMQVTMFGVVSGASVFTAQYWGTRDLRGIHKTLTLGMLTASGVALLFALPAVFAPDALMRVLISDEASFAARAEGTAYLRVIGFAYFFQAISMVQAAVLKSTEQVKLPMYGSIFAILTNLSLNYLLIFGNLGFPRLGVTGGAIATVTGCAVELGVLLIVSYKMHFANAAPVRNLRPGTREDARRFFRVVLPTTGNESLWSLAMVMYSVAYGMMGEGTIAAVGIFNNIEQLSVVALRGATHACAVMIGMAIGSGRNDEARLIARRMMMLSIATGVAVGALVLAASPLVVTFFPVPASTAESARKLINTYACFIWLTSAACMIVVGVLRSGGDVKHAMMIDVLTVWFVGIPLVFLAGPVLNWQIHMVYLASRVEEVFKVALGFKRLSGDKWINNLAAEGGENDGKSA